MDASLAALRPWFPWSAEDPRPVQAHAALLAAHAADFAAARWWGYGVWRLPVGDGGPALIGALGVYRARADSARPSVRELSYWLTPEATGQGYAAEGVAALAEAALAAPGVLGLEIRIDPANERSARLPPRLGFALRERLTGDRADADGRPLDTIVWERATRPPRLRLATPDDLPQLATIRARARTRVPAHPARAADDAALVAAGRCWVWADDRGVHGFAAAAPTRRGEIATLWVDPVAERRGIGAALLAQLTDVLWLGGHRRLACELFPGRRAERLLRAAGWTVVGIGAAGRLRFRRDL